MERRDKVNYYLDIARTVANRGTCIRRKFGSIIVKNDEIISTGYAGAPRGRLNCNELGVCTREKLKIPKGERYEMCRSVHAEANAIISASRRDMIGASIYISCIDPESGEDISGTNSCSMCKRMIINAGIEKVYIRDDEKNYRVYDVEEWINNDDSLSVHEGY